MNRLIIVENYLCYLEKYSNNRIGESGTTRCVRGMGRWPGENLDKPRDEAHADKSPQAEQTRNGGRNESE